MHILLFRRIKGFLLTGMANFTDFGYNRLRHFDSQLPSWVIAKATYVPFSCERPRVLAGCCLDAEKKTKKAGKRELSGPKGNPT